jgi:hypothetical protein
MGVRSADMRRWRRDTVWSGSKRSGKAKEKFDLSFASAWAWPGLGHPAHRPSSGLPQILQGIKVPIVIGFSSAVARPNAPISLPNQ